MAKLLGCLVVGIALAAPAADEILNLPGWTGELPTKHYSGYLNISKSKHLHYWLVESEGTPATDPIVLWLNGGPGCSSLDGFIYEHGPFRPDPMDDTKLVPFEHSWNKLANMIYLEAPVGVGFSYSTDSKEYRTDDDQTANDNLAAMERFFELFPEYAQNNFFITGESYGGVYVPTLAEAIVNATAAGSYTGAPLKGIAVGNGCTGNSIGVCGGERDKYELPYLMGTALISSPLKEKLKQCDFDNISAACRALIVEAQAAIGHVNLYGIYSTCGKDDESFSKIGNLGERAPGGPDACINSVEASAYFNQASVQAAIHVRKPDFEWAVCANQIQYSSTRANLPRDTYPALAKAIRVLIYNGDWDACVPYTDNEAWTQNMGFDVADAWHPWLYKGKQVGGYATRYSENDFSFITIKGGRHEVPETAPEQAFEMLRRVINMENF